MESMKKYERFLGFSLLLVVMDYIPIFKDEEKTTFIMTMMEFIMINSVFTDTTAQRRE